MARLLVLAQFDRRQHWEMAYEAVLDKIRAGESGSLVIDLGSVTFIPAEGVLALVNIARLWHRHSKEATVLKWVQRQVLLYLERMDAFVHDTAYLMAADTLPTHECWERSAASTNLLELQPIASAEADNARDVSRAVTRAQSILATWLDGDTLRVGRLCTMLSELASNIVHSDDQGFAIIQRYTGTASPFSGSTISIAIADLGIGIEASLRHRGTAGRTKVLGTGSDYILHALQLGVSSREMIAGTGLYQIKQQIQEASGTLVIRSQRSEVALDGSTHRVRDDLACVPGTQVSLTICVL